MRSERWAIRAITMGLAWLPFAGLVLAADQQERPFGGPSPDRNVEERPFGGPPPNNRSLPKLGKKCQTSIQVCDLTKRQTLGSDCQCSGVAPPLPGKVIQ